LTIKQDAYNKDTDDKELGVCNYYTTPIPQPVGNGYSVISVSGELCVGSTRTLSVKFYEADGTENTSIVANWKVDLPDGFESYFVVKANGNTCTITVNDDDYVTIDSVVDIITTSNGLGGYIGTKSMIVTA
jgi:phage-related protein